MNRKQINQQTNLIKSVTSDCRLTTTHLSLFMAILSCWQAQNCTDSIKITRRGMMRLSKIAAISTYHRCMKHLIKYGYFNYKPSYDHYFGTRITLLNVKRIGESK
jgi:hypothetical protein